MSCDCWSNMVAIISYGRFYRLLKKLASYLQHSLTWQIITAALGIPQMWIHHPHSLSPTLNCFRIHNYESTWWPSLCIMLCPHLWLSQNWLLPANCTLMLWNITPVVFQEDPASLYYPAATSLAVFSEWGVPVSPQAIKEEALPS